MLVKAIKIQGGGRDVLKLLPLVAFRYNDLWILSGYADEALNIVMDKLREAGAQVEVTEFVISRDRLIEYLEQYAAELRRRLERSRATHIRDELRTVEMELESLKRSRAREAARRGRRKLYMIHLEVKRLYNLIKYYDFYSDDILEDMLKRLELILKELRSMKRTLEMYRR